MFGKEVYLNLCQSRSVSQVNKNFVELPDWRVSNAPNIPEEC